MNARLRNLRTCDLRAYFLGGFRQDLPFCLFHHSLLQYLGSVALLNVYRLLRYDLTAVRNFVNEMYRCSGDLDPLG